MSEKEHSGVYEGMSRFAEKCFNPAGAKKAAAWSIDTTEKLATQALDFQVKATAWAKETPSILYSRASARPSAANWSSRARPPLVRSGSSRALLVAGGGGGPSVTRSADSGCDFVGGSRV